MEWKTAISTVKNNETIIRNKNLTDLAQNQSFAANFYFILTGKQASQELARLIDMIFSLSIDHGLGAVSAQSARIAASAGATVPQALIAALASMGRAHGGATEDAAFWLQEKVKLGVDASVAVKEALAGKKKIPGYGHSILTRDSRVDVLLSEAKKLNLAGCHTEYALKIQEEIKKQKGLDIPFNIDGVIASLALDMGISPNAAISLFIIGRLPGLVAHIQEEREQAAGLRRIKEEDIIYLDS